MLLRMRQVCTELKLGCTITRDRKFTGSLDEPGLQDFAIPSFCLYYHDTAHFDRCVGQLQEQLQRVLLQATNK